MITFVLKKKESIHGSSRSMNVSGISMQTFILAFQVSADSGSADLNTHDAKAMQTKHMSDCLKREKTPSRPALGITVQFIHQSLASDLCYDILDLLVILIISQICCSADAD